jgi:opacity protein-like surface antigen
MKRFKEESLPWKIAIVIAGILAVIGIIVMLVIALIGCNVEAQEISVTAGQYLPTDNGTESNWSARAEVRTWEDLWLGIGIENGQRQHVIELYEFTFYDISARYNVTLTDKLGSYVRLGYYFPQVEDKGLTTKEAFYYLAAAEVPGPMTWYDRVDVSLDPGFGAEIGLNYRVSKRLDFNIGYRFLRLEEHLMGYGVEAGQPRNYWRERQHDFSAFNFGLTFKF